MNDWTDEELRSARAARTSAGMCKPGCACQTEDAMTTPLDLEDIE